MALGSFRKPNKDIRSIYMNMVGRLTLDDLVDRLKTESEEVLFHISKLLDGSIEVTDFPFWNHTQLYKYAFYGHTDLKGITKVLPLKEGYWKISVSKKTQYLNQKECDKNINEAFLTLKVKGN